MYIGYVFNAGGLSLSVSMSDDEKINAPSSGGMAMTDDLPRKLHSCPNYVSHQIIQKMRKLDSYVAYLLLAFSWLNVIKRKT